MSPSPKQLPRVLCIWLPNWPVQRILAVEPQLAERPLVLSQRDSRRGLLVAAANREAKQAGVQPGMRLSEAIAAAPLEIREHDPDEDIATLCHLAEQAQRFSPLVGLEQLDAKPWAGRSLHQPECLLLDVTGIAKLFGGEANLLFAVAQWLSSQRHFGCLAISHSIGAAWALANYRLRSRRHATLLPLPAESTETESAESEPASQVSNLPACRGYRPGIDPRPLEEDVLAIERLPLVALRLQPATIVALHRLGVHRIGQLAQLPRDGLASRLGSSLLARWDQARGLKEEPLTALYSSPDWQLQQELEYPTDRSETIFELVRRLVDQLAERLQRRGQGALRIVCRLDLVESPPLILQLGLFRPSSQASHLQMLLTGQLEQQLHQLAAAPLWRLSLQATLTAPLIWRQTELFDEEHSDQRREIARLIDHLSSRLGRRQVLVADVRRESQPELACVFRPRTGRRPNGSAQETAKKLSSRLSRKRAEPSIDDPLRRPTHLFPEPLPIEVAGRWTAEPVGTDWEDAMLPLATAPARIRYQQQWHEVVQACGPERLESGWWRGPSVRRDYYRLVTRQGGWWWIFRDLNDGQWHLHGVFD